MIDTITIQRIQLIHPLLRDELNSIYNRILAQGIQVRFTRTLSTIEEQNQLYAKGRTTEELIKEGITGIEGKPELKVVTNAKGGESYHNYGLSVDFVLLHENKTISWNRNEDIDKDGEKDWNEVVNIFKSCNWEWGGSWQFKDYPHFQYTFGYTTKELQLKKKDINNYPIL